MLFFPRKIDISRLNFVAALWNFWLSWRRRFHQEIENTELPVARLNVDDEWFITDPRRGKLIAKVGCPFKADGMVLAAWRLAQRYWRDGEQLIPEDIWEMSDLEPLVEARLAHRDDEKSGVYVAGTKAAFEWLMEEATSGSAGGKASVKARKSKYGTAQPVSPNKPRTTPNDPERPQSFDEQPEQPSNDCGRSANAPEGCSRTPNPLPLPPPLTLTQENNTPLSPPVTSVRDRELSRWAKDAAAHAAATALICLNAYREGKAPTVDPEKAERALGPRTYRLATNAYDGWDRFVNEYARRRARSEEGFFVREMEVTFRALLPEVLAELAAGERGGTGPPMSPSEEGLS